MASPVSSSNRLWWSTYQAAYNFKLVYLIKLWLILLLFKVFSNKSLGTQASRDVLKDLTNSVITLLLDSRLMDLGEGPQVVRAVNTTVIRIMENSNFTNMLR